ncbi:MAG TPA: SDR family NAD(P)-dependent oxidoreductase [Phycisphaerae bacterium]|nr:SDR family NAD(P)-dependent oxidoreductase [Phycisphaerae bacterium]
MSVHGKVVLITGATTAMGRQLVGLFLNQGASLAIGVRRVSELTPLRQSLAAEEERLFIVPCDVRDEGDVVRTVHRVIRRFGRIDVLINAAAITGPKTPVVDYPIDPWRNVIATNLTGTYLLCREVLPWMTRQGCGSIINVTSSLTTSARPEWGAYLVSTHSIEGLTRLLATELKGSGVRVNSVEVAAPAGTGRSDESEWLQAFLWLASDESAAKNGERIRAADFASAAS